MSKKIIEGGQNNNYEKRIEENRNLVKRKSKISTTEKLSILAQCSRRETEQNILLKMLATNVKNEIT